MKNSGSEAAGGLSPAQVAAERDNLLGIFDASPSPNVLWRTRDLIYERVTPSYQKLFPGRQLIGKPFREAVPEPEYEQFFETIQSVFDTGTPITLKEQLVKFDVDGQGMRDFYYTLSFFQIRNSDGKPYGVYQQAVDNTEQIYAREVLKASAQALEKERAELAFERHKLQTVFEETPAAMALWRGPDFIFEKVNPRYQAIFAGRVLEGIPFLEACPEFVGTSFAQKLQHVLTTGVPYIGHEELAPILNLETGKLDDRYFDFTYLQINDASGKPYGVYDHAVDVTDRVVARKKAEFEQLKLKTIIANSTASIAVLRGPDFVFEIVNKGYSELFSDRDLVGLPFLEALPELKGQEFPEHAKRVFKTGVPYVDREAMALLKRTDDGPVETRYFDQTYSRILDSEGQAYGIFIHAQEVTDRVEARMVVERAKTQVEAERQKLAAMIHVSPIGIGLMRGEELVFEMVNDRFRELVGDRDYIGRTWQQVYSELPNSPLLPIMLEVLRTGNPHSAYEMPLRIEVAPGVVEDRFYDFTYAQVKDGQKNPYGVYLQCSNVTDRVVAKNQLEENLVTLEAAKVDALRARDEAERANELKSAFLANMSHEIRTPLGAMMGFADLLKDPGLTANERQSFTNILTRNGESLSVIINDILDLSKVEAGHLTLEFTDTYPDKIGSDVVSLMRVKADEKDLVLEYSHDETIPESFVSDPIRVRQVLLNLVGNAIKFTHFGSVTLRSFACKSERGRDALCFEVKDTGIGIAEDKHDQIFEMFVQADGSMTRRFGGTGLGLSLSRHLARAMGGDIKITSSKEGFGSTFLVTIEDQPDKKSVAPEAISRSISSSQALPEKALEGLSILVVDDAPDNQQLIWRYLTKQGAAVTSAENGLLGYRAALAGNFDLVLMDIQMPVMDGYSATQKLREAGYPKPVIALTAHAMNEVRRKALNVGYSDHLTKPINAPELIATIVRHVRK